MKARYICLALTAALFCSLAGGQWKQIGPYIGPATCFATSGSRVFAGMYGGMVGGGIFVSTDNGTSWTAVNTGLPDSNVTALAVSGTSVLAGTSSGVFLSTDNGAHWTSAISGLYVYSFGVCGTKLFAAAADSGERIFISTDSGISWNAANMPFPRFSSMLQLGSILYAGVNDGVVGPLYLSPDNGDSWTLSNNGLAAPYVSALAVSGIAVFAGTRNGIFRSTNSGASWTAVDSGLTSTNVRALAVSGNSLFAGTDSGIFLSTDNGDTWHTANSGLVSKSVYVLFVSGTRIFASTSLGISVSTDNGSNWAVRKPGRNPNVGITALAAEGPELFVAAAWGGGSKSTVPVQNCVFHSTDNGESWTPQLAAEADAIVIRASDVFVGSGTGSWLGKGMLRSTDDGTTWTAVNEGFPKATVYGDTSGYAPVTCFAANGQTLFAGTHGSGVYSTTNDGMSWKAASNGLTSYYVRALLTSGDYVIVATDSGVFRSTNSGTSWSASNEGFPPPAPPGYSAAWGVNSFVTMGTSLFAGGWHSWERGIVFRSTDHGTHWTAAETDFARQVSGMGVSGTNLFAGTWCCDSLYLSTDGGARWRSVGPVGDFGTGGDLATNDTYVLAGTGRYNMWGASGAGLLRHPLSEMITSVGPGKSELPQECLLQQNYPNPFNPSTTIRYGLPHKTAVQLAVFNTLGQQIALLQNGEQDAGYHEMKFDAANLSSGVYFYRLQTGGFVQSKKLMLLK